jgi:two-component system OmpR family sensor kinase
VRTTAEIALSRPRPADEYRQALKDVLAHAEHMSALVGDLLLLARADAGVEAGESGPVDLSEVARDVGEEFQLAAARRSLGFVVSAETAVDVRGDAGSFRRLFVILLENAVAYTPPDGKIDLRVTRSDAAGTPTAVVEVIDTGIGIDPDDRARVFDRFYRGAAARAQAADGSGLGLSIARTIVERARGTIEIDAGPGGRGCHVRVRLPADGERPEVEHASGRTHRVDLDRVGAGVGGPDAAGH